VLFGPAAPTAAPADPAALPEPADQMTAPPAGGDDHHRPVRSHRRRQSHRALVGRLGAAAMILIALAVGNVVTEHVPDVDTQEEPYIRTGSFGHPIDLRTFDASVLSVRGAAVLNDPEPDIATSPTHDTSGVWVIVRIRVVAVDKPVEVTYAAVRDAEGRIYLATTRFEQPFVDGERTLQPGVPVTGEVAFEVPVTVVPQLSLRLAAPGITHDLRMTAMADVPLHISAGTARQWKADTTPATLAPPAVVQ
jgi:hypothetical protein